MRETLFRLLRKRDVLIGVAIITVFLVIATAGAALVPYNNPYNSNDYYVAAPMAVPSWARLFPWYSNLPPDISLPSNSALQAFKLASAVTYWTADVKGATHANITYDPTQGPSGMSLVGSGAYIQTNTGGGSELISASGNSQSPIMITLTHSFSYTYSPPKMFYQQVLVKPLSVKNAGLAIFLFVRNSKGTYLLGLSADSSAENALESGALLGTDYATYFSDPTSTPLASGQWNYISGISTSPSTMPLYQLNSTVARSKNIGESIFGTKANYTVGELIEIFPQGNYSVELAQSDFKFQILGSAYGALGTDTRGADVWSEFAAGTQTSLIIGFGATAVTMFIGVPLGLFSGFFGGLLDNFFIFIFDILLLLPGLTLLIDLDTTFTIAHVSPNRVLLIILLIGTLSWPVSARLVRSQVLSLRSRTYIEASRTMGASDMGILRRHILPHTAATIIAIVTYVAPGLITVDAGLDFLGLGIVNRPTWGNMLANLVNDINPGNGYLWWISLPVGLSIIVISIAFYLAGTGIQEEYGRIA